MARLSYDSFLNLEFKEQILDINKIIQCLKNVSTTVKNAMRPVGQLVNRKQKEGTLGPVLQLVAKKASKPSIKVAHAYFQYELLHYEMTNIVDY